MHRLLVFLTLLIPLFASAQSVYMHEAQEESENSEPISALGIIAFAIFVGVIYLIYKSISEASRKSERKKFEAKLEETKRQQSTINEGGFICPVCGKHVIDDNYVTMWRILEGHSCAIKFCKSCGNSYRNYEKEYDKYQKRDSEGLPDWLGIIIFVLMIALGLYILIKDCIRGEVFMGIIGMFITPAVVGGILGLVLQFFIKLFWNPKPSEPFKIPSLKHIKECNAIERRYV